MSGIDPIPAGDQEFDTLQAILVAAVATNALAWGIPTTEITKVTDKQTIWAAAWLIAKDKQNSSSTQKKAKDVARKNYEKVLRPFIQKWIFLNDALDEADIEECGLKPHDTTHTPAVKPEAGTVSVARGGISELIATCLAQKGAKYYGCIMVEGAPLPDWFVITADGKIVVDSSKFKPEPNPGAGAEPDTIIGVQFDLTSQRIKKFMGLKHGVTYYFYFYVVNAAGVSPLSEAVSLVCW